MGAQTSTSQTWVDNAVHGAIDTIMNTRVDASVNLSCKNQQLVQNATNCQIQFADQVCKAVGISNFTGNQEQTSAVSQDVMNDIVAAASASTEGITVGFNSSRSSTYVQNMTDLSMNVTQSFMTNCTRNINNINEQAVNGCFDSVIKFAPQDVSSEVIGDCVASQVGTLTAAQKITNTIDAASEAVTKGFDPLAVLLVVLILAALVIFGPPLFLGAMRKALAKSRDPNDKEAQATRAKMIGVTILFVILVLSMILWWPGYFSYKLGVAPWSFPGVISDKNRTPICVEGKNMKRDTFINEFMWWDPYCVTASPNEPCNDETKSKHYQGCGLFASSAGCDDPLFVQQRQRYIEVNNECGKIAGVSYPYCTAREIAASVFAPDEGAYQGCTKCTTDNDNWGLWVEEGNSCDSGISQLDYRRKKGKPCDVNDPHCKDGNDDLMATSPNECKVDSYQEAKAIYSKHLRVCNRLEEISVVTTASKGEKPLLAEQCPPDAFDYFTKCHPGTKKCKYIAQGCTGCNAETGECEDCSAADALVVASCKNDYDKCCWTDANGTRVCNDADYEKDLDLYNYWNSTCKKRWELHRALNPTAWAVTLGIYVLSILAIIVLLVRTPAVTQSGALREAAVEVTSKSSFNIAIFVVLVLINLAAGMPLGILGLVNEGKGLPMSIYEADTTSKINAWDEKKATMTGWSFFGISIALIVLQIGLSLRRRAKEKMKTIKEDD